MKDFRLSRADAWNADITIADFLSQILRLLAEDGHGYPVLGLSDDPVVKGESGDPGEDWKNALVACANVFENYANDGARTWNYNEDVIEALDFLKNHFFSLWD